MKFLSSRFGTAAVPAAVVLSGLLLASCAVQDSPPRQVEAANPKVTYKYRGDEELIQANLRAETFCENYQAVPRVADFSNDPADGLQVVTFECLPQSTSMAILPGSDADLTYTYRTDQELLDASRSARLYCAEGGSRRVISSITTNTDGTKEVQFECRP